MFTRSQAARFLGCTVRRVRWLEESGQLPAKRGKGGARIFLREDLQAFRAQPPGTLAARAFAAFERGLTPVQAVVELEALPNEIERLHTAWARMTGAWVVAGPRGPRHVWEQMYGIGRLDGDKVRSALELVASSPELRSKLLR